MADNTLCEWVDKGAFKMTGLTKTFSYGHPTEIQNRMIHWSIFLKTFQHLYFHIYIICVASFSNQMENTFSQKLS